MAESLRRILRAVRAATFLLVLTTACVALAAAAYFGAARFVDSPAAASLVAALTLLASTFGCWWWRAPALGIAERRRPAVSSAGALLVLVLAVAISWQFVFRRFEPAPALDRAAAHAQHWNLPTGSTIAYTRVTAQRSRGAPPLIYLHGGPAVPPRRTIREFLAPLAEDGFDVYLYDQFGSGSSGRADDIAEYTLQRHVADLEAIRRELGADRLVLVGSSWGAVLAGYYMAAHPDRVERAVLLSPGILARRSEHPYDFSRTASSEDPSIILPPLRMIVAGALARVNTRHAEAFASQAELGAVFDGFTASGSLEYQSHCKGGFRDGGPAPAATRSAGGNYYANLIALRSLRQAPDPRPALRAVKAPVLLLRGDCDYVPLSSALAWRDALPRSTLLQLPDAGHALTSEARKSAFSAVRAFLAEPPVAPSSSAP